MGIADEVIRETEDEGELGKMRERGRDGRGVGGGQQWGTGMEM